VPEWPQNDSTKAHASLNRDFRMSCTSHCLVPAGFVVPETLETPRFKLRMLTIHDVEKDYEAVMSSVEYLQTIWNTKWPMGLTLEQNLVDLGWHQKEFQRRSSFAYTVVRVDESQVLGCVYIYPSKKAAYDAEVYLWAREDSGQDLESELEASVRAWIGGDWPFTRVAFPGRDMPLAAWNDLEID
jgi:hypothetical protein